MTYGEDGFKLSSKSLWLWVTKERIQEKGKNTNDGGLQLHGSEEPDLEIETSKPISNFETSALQRATAQNSAPMSSGQSALGTLEVPYSSICISFSHLTYLDRQFIRRR